MCIMYIMIYMFLIVEIMVIELSISKVYNKKEIVFIKFMFSYLEYKNNTYEFYRTLRIFKPSHINLFYFS